jgi:RNA polymerase sigma-70 factor (ECF subfamily)
MSGKLEVFSGWCVSYHESSTDNLRGWKVSLPIPSEEQVRRWYRRLYGTALRLTGNEADAADLTQQTFCNALDNWHSFDGRSLPTTWLHGILLNRLRDRIRRDSRRRNQPLEPWAVPSGPLADPAEQVQRAEEFQRLREAVDDLPDDLRRAFVATVLDGYTYEQAGELLNVPPGTVGSRVHLARHRVYRAIGRAFLEA